MEVIQSRSKFSFKSFFKQSVISPLDYLIQWSVFLIVFLVPIFFLTSNQSMFDLNKSLIFCLLTLIGVLSWLGKLVFKKEFTFRRTILDIPLIVFGLLYIFVTIFSKNWFSSIAGVSNYYHHSLVVIIFLILFYFLIVNNFRTLRDITGLLVTFIASGVLVAVVSLLQILGAYIFVSDVTKDRSFNLIFNSVTMLGIFLAVFLPVIISFLVSVRKTVWRFILIVVGLVDFSVLFLIDSNIVWYTLIGCLFVFLIFLTLRSRDFESRWAILPTILLVLAAVLIFVDVPNTTNIALPGDIVLDHTTTWKIARSTLTSAPLFGTGPGMFSHAFSEYRPDSFNDTVLWNLSFIKSSSEFTQILITTGLLVTVIYLYLFLRFGFSMLMNLVKERDNNLSWLIRLGLFIAWAGLFVVSFFYPFSFVIFFVLWLMTALSVSLITKEKGEMLETKPSPATGFLSSVVFSMLIVLGIVFIYGAVTIWLADYHYTNGNQALIDNDVKKAQIEYNRATELNAHEAIYHFSLAQSFINEAQTILPQSTEDINEITNLVTLSRVASSNGLNIDTERSAAYQNYIQIYSGLIQYDPTLSSELIAAYNKLIELDEKNPLNYMGAGDNAVTIAQLIISSVAEEDEEQATQAQEQANQLYQQAMDSYKKAANLKNDYVAAELKYALVSELMGDDSVAISGLEDLAQKYSQRDDVQYELGRIYYKNDQIEDAKKQFVTALNINPDHANAAFQLGEIVQSEGDKDMAITLFTRVLSNNPDNESVRQRLEELGVTIKDQSDNSTFEETQE